MGVDCFAEHVGEVCMIMLEVLGIDFRRFQALQMARNWPVFGSVSLPQQQMSKKLLTALTRYAHMYNMKTD